MLDNRRRRGLSLEWPLSRSQTASDVVTLRLLSTISSVAERSRSTQPSGRSFSKSR